MATTEQAWINSSQPEAPESLAGVFAAPEMDFRKETLYFIVVDRFFNRSSSNDQVGKEGLFDASRQQWGKYWGGDLRGVIDKADYLQALGVTALWLSPLFEQVDDHQMGHAAMHGYWTQDFKRVNPHFISDDDNTSVTRSRILRELVETFHQRNIKLILDIVCNHSSPDINGRKGVVYDDGQLLADYNNDHNNFYYHNGSITDWEDEYQLIHHEMMGLATFNEKNNAFRAYIKQAIRLWLDIGFDGLRIDTLKHMPIWFWQEFVSDLRRSHPEAFMFGEYGFGNPKDSRTLAYANHSGVSILDFGLADAIREAFAQNSASGFHSVESILEIDHVYKRSTELVTFIDNHDMPRFLSVCSHPKDLEVAVVLLMTLRGIPCLFYGTEQFLVNNTNGGNDPYNRPMMELWDENSFLFRSIRTLAELRKSNAAVAYGTHQQKYITDSLYAFSRRYRQSSVLTVLNKGDDTSLSIQDCDLPDGEHRCLLSGERINVNRGVIEQLIIPARSARVFSVQGPDVSGKVIVMFQLNNFFTQPGQIIAVSGDAPELGEWNLDLAPRLHYINADTWFSEVGFERTAGKIICFRFVVLRHDDHDPHSRAQHENLMPRRFLLPKAGRIKLEHDWESF